MAVTKAKKTEIQQRRQQVADLYVQGWTQMAIAERLNVTQTTICDDLKRLREEWRASRIRDFDAARELEIQKLDRLEREAWAAWERSQKPSQSAEFGDDTSNTPKKKRVKNSNGDPRFLVVVHQCIASRRALLGLDALPALPKEDSDGNSAERAQRLAGLLTEISNRDRTEGNRTLVVEAEPRIVCDDSERGQVENGPSPGLPGPSNHGVD